MFRFWLQRLRQQIFPTAQRGQRRWRRRFVAVPRLEELEDRVVLATSFPLPFTPIITPSLAVPGTYIIYPNPNSAVPTTNPNNPNNWPEDIALEQLGVAVPQGQLLPQRPVLAGG